MNIMLDKTSIMNQDNVSKKKRAHTNGTKLMQNMQKHSFTCDGIPIDEI